MLRLGKVLGTIVLLATALSHSATSATIGFKPAVNYAVGTKPVAVAAADFDGDGKIDLAVVNSGDASVGDDGGVSILLGNGDGTFRAAVNIPAGKSPVSIAVADFNGDHRLDLAVINFDGGSGNVCILLGNGNGTFQSPADYAVASGPNVVAVADFNGDHKPDLVVSASSISVLLGNGDGTFQSHVDLAFGGRGIAVADFNDDGKDDLAALAFSTVIALGNGDGTFQPATPVSSLSTGITLGDFNGDGKIDVFSNFHEIFAPAGSPHNVGVLSVGNGDGTFHSGVATGLDLIDSGSVFQADFNGDGKLDLVKPQVQGSAVFVWPGSGAGTFVTSPLTLTVGSSPSQVATADLDGNKSPDIVVTNTGHNTISVLLNTVGTDFSIFASDANPSILHLGERATSTLSLGLLNAFDNPVSMTCAVQPAQAGSPTCSINPHSVTFDTSGKATADLIVAAGTATASLTPSVHQGPQSSLLLWLPIAGLMFSGVGLYRGHSSKQRLLVFFAGSFLFAGLVLQSACGGGGNNNGSKAQTYTVTVTGASGSTKHSTAITLRVQ